MYRLTEPGKKYQVGSFCRYRLIPQGCPKEDLFIAKKDKIEFSALKRSFFGQSDSHIG
jgi:hypothetical protein